MGTNFGIKSQNLITSMLRHVAAFISAKGGHTKYLISYEISLVLVIIMVIIVHL